MLKKKPTFSYPKIADCLIWVVRPQTFGEQAGVRCFRAIQMILRHRSWISIALKPYKMNELSILFALNILFYGKS